jgi:hypothetical protein
MSRFLNYSPSIPGFTQPRIRMRASRQNSLLL